MKPFTISTTLAVCALAGCQMTTAAFSPVNAEKIPEALHGVSCTSPQRRSPNTVSENGFEGHPVLMCVGSEPLGYAFFWSKTNAAGTALVTKPTNLSGVEYEVGGGGWDQDTGTNTVAFALDTTAGQRVCTVIKPAGGIAPYARVACS